MKTTALSIMLSFFWINLFAQDFTISFQAKVSGTIIDSVVVLNQRTGQKVKLIGNESLTLTKVTSVNDIPFTSPEGLLYPNPCNGYSEVSFATSLNQEVKVSVYNISGQLLSTKSHFLMPGKHKFGISFRGNGIYNISVLKKYGSISYKAVSLRSAANGCGIDYLGSEYLDQKKSAKIDKTLSYTLGDILLNSVFSNKKNTYIADSPTANKTYSVEFYECKDTDNNNYPIVKIGTQWWMAANMKTTKYNDGTDIPNIANATSWSELTTGAFCWYNNDAVKNKDLYGGLFNWYTVKTGKLCPTGWHMPSDAEWYVLENYLISNGYNFDGTTSGNLIGKSMAAQTLWNSFLSEAPGLVGNNLYLNNKSGFSALPGGKRSKSGAFGSIEYNCGWWSSTESTTVEAWYRGLAYSNWYLGRYDTDKEDGHSIRCVKD